MLLDLRGGSPDPPRTNKGDTSRMWEVEFYAPPGKGQP
jgi:hypothetical protein